MARFRYFWLMFTHRFFTNLQRTTSKFRGHKRILKDADRKVKGKRNRHKKTLTKHAEGILHFKLTFQCYYWEPFMKDFSASF